MIAGVVHRSVLRNGERRNIIDRALSHSEDSAERDSGTFSDAGRLALVSDGVFRVAAVQLVAGKASQVTEVFPPCSAVPAMPTGEA